MSSSEQSHVLLTRTARSSAAIMSFATIDQLIATLRAARVHGLEQYEEKLRDNAGNSGHLEDLACEGFVALTFARYGWSVVMRESPDLEVRKHDFYLGVEVKHFRWKQKHDPIEDAVLRSRELTFARVPPLSETEGHENAFDQMYRIAAKNASQLLVGELNIIFFWCSTQAHYDSTFKTAVHIYIDALESGSCNPKMRNLTGMMMNGIWATIEPHRRKVFFEPVWNSNKPATVELEELLNEMREPGV